MGIEGDDVGVGWDEVRPVRQCLLPGCKEEECVRGRAECRDCARTQEFRGLEVDGPMVMWRLAILPDHTIEWERLGPIEDLEERP